ncbi:MAG: thioesterase domain-containing protein [Deltaproteobacteria bacterium]|nr:thioesterase domain-containing protein [Deltaproteobacteria bacterium]
MTPAPVLLCFKPRATARVRLVAFPWAGSSAAGLRPLADALARAEVDVELHAVAYAARAHRRAAPLPRSLDDVVDDLLPSLLELTPPVALYGHSFGALAAFFCALALSKRGKPPVHLVAAARVAPSVDVSGSFYGGTPSPDNDDDDDVIALLASHGLIDASLFGDPEARALLLPPLRCDLRLSEQTRSDAVVDVPITAVRGRGDPSVDPAGLARWSSHTSKRFASVDVDGDHLFVRDQAAAVAALLSQVLQT